MSFDDCVLIHHAFRLNLYVHQGSDENSQNEVTSGISLISAILYNNIALIMRIKIIHTLLTFGKEFLNS